MPAIIATVWLAQSAILEKDKVQSRRLGNSATLWFVVAIAFCIAGAVMLGLGYEND